jgi:hypothetical protein
LVDEIAGIISNDNPGDGSEAEELGNDGHEEAEEALRKGSIDRLLEAANEVKDDAPKKEKSIVATNTNNSNAIDITKELANATKKTVETKPAESKK